DARLSIALKKYDPETDKNYIFEVPVGGIFRIHNGKTFKKGSRRRKRYECVEVASGKVYLFQPNAQVELLAC
ncbi:MAG: sprT domain-containing protein, partial [Gillisia sp.]